jgi:hypothetical protein
MFKKQVKQKTYSPAKIADLYLRALASGREVFLNIFLAEENIYHDINSLAKVEEMLQEAGYVEEVNPGGFSIFTYNPPGTALEATSGEIASIP